MAGKHDEHIEEIINYFAISLFGQNTVDDILWDLARNCISKLGFEDCVVYLVDDARKVLVQKAAYGPKNPRDFTIHQPLEIPIGHGIVGMVAKTGVGEIISDTSKDSRYIQDDAFRFSEICVPIVLEERVIGIIDSEHSQRNFFTLKHLNTLRLIASLCSNKIMRARAEQEKRDHEIKLQETRQKLSTLSLRALRAQMNPHFIFNALNAIQYFITENRSAEALKYLSLFGRFIRKTLESYDRSFLSLALEIDSLESYLKLEKVRFGDRFHFEIGVDPDIDVNETEIPVSLIQPFVARALTDGMLNQKKQGMLRIFFEKAEIGIRCKIEHNIPPAGGADHHDPISAIQLPESIWGIQERIDLINHLFTKPVSVAFLGSGIEIHIPIDHEVQDLKARIR